MPRSRTQAHVQARKRVRHIPDITPQSPSIFASADSPPAPVSAELDALFDATVAHLRDVHHAAFLHYALGVGEYLLDTYCTGDLLLYRDRRSAEHVGFEALLEHRKEALADLGLTVQTLRNYFKIRFRFNTGDGQNNGFAGPFVDELKVFGAK